MALAVEPQAPQVTRAELTKAYQAQQAMIRGQALGEMFRLWPIWDLTNLDPSWEQFETALLAVMERYHRMSAVHSARYYRVLRQAQGIEGEAEIVSAEFDRGRWQGNLRLLGPIFTKKSIANNRPNPKDIALVRVSGVVTAGVLDGGRTTLLSTGAADPRSTGFRRVTAGTCGWCLQLAAWGAFERNGPGWKGHTNCRCSAEPQFEDQLDNPYELGSITPLGDLGRSLRGTAPFENPTIGIGIKERFETVARQLLGFSDEVRIRDYDVQRAAKLRVQERIGNRLDDRFGVNAAGRQKLADAREEIHGMAYDYDAYTNTSSYGQSLSASLVGEWAGTSGDSSPLALALQKTAARRYGLDFDPTIWRRGGVLTNETLERMDGLIERHGEIFDAFLDDMYRETQDLLDAMYPGQTHVPLGRGWNSWDEAQLAGMKVKETTMTAATMNPMSSFSVAEEIADSFGNVQMRGMVPKDRIIGTPLSGYGCIHEYEFVVLGAPKPDALMVWRSVG